MYRYLIVIMPLISLIILRILLRKSSKKIKDFESKNIQKNIVRQPITYKYFGYADCFGFILISVLCFIFGESTLEALLATLIVFLPLSISGIFMILYGRNWAIIVSADNFQFRNIFGKIKNFNFNEITIKRINSGYRIYKDGKHIVGVGHYQVNSLELSEAIYKYYKNKNNC